VSGGDHPESACAFCEDLEERCGRCQRRCRARFLDTEQNRAFMRPVAFCQTLAAPSPAPPLPGRPYTVWLLAPKAVVQYQPVNVIVQVRTSRGQLVDGLPVEFRLTPSSTRDTWILPHHTITRRGIARAMLQAGSVGMVQVTARVGTITKHADIAVLVPLARSVRVVASQGGRQPC
jgi:hypothetical protein